MMQLRSTLATALNAHLSGSARHLRRTIPVAIAMGLVAVAGLTLSGTLTASNGDRQGECNLGTLRGRYLFANSGLALPPAFGVTQPTWAADAGFIVFDGDGMGTANVTVRIGGNVVLRNLVTPVSYTVNADCTGSYTVPNGPSFDLFIAPGGEEYALIATDPSGNYPSSIQRRVARR
jgi:hypothetical protein